MAIPIRKGTKMHNIHSLLARASEAYKRALIGYQAGLSWDYLVLTAANEHQAIGYRHELTLRSSGAGPMGSFFPASQKTLVVPDPPKFRAGSGGATFGAISAIARHQHAHGDKRSLESLRILLIHSGGASQRLPQFSPLGKIFAPLPLVRPDGQLMTIFDHLYLMTAALPQRLGPGLLAAAGDVFVLFDATAIPAPPPGITALSMRVPVALGQHHGVFLTPAPRPGTDRLAAFPLVTATLQKATIAQLHQAGATDIHDRVLIDSGLLFFDAAATMALHRLARKYTAAWHLRNHLRIDLYADVVPAALMGLPPLPVQKSLRHRLEMDLRHALANSPLHCHELPQAHFQHLGTTRQFRDAMTGLDHAPACRLFNQNVRLTSQSPIPASARAYQSVISTTQARIAPHVLIENCMLAAPIHLGQGCVVSNLSIPPGTPKLVIPAEILVFGVPIAEAAGRSTVTVVCGINDDPKTDATFCNIDLQKWLTTANIAAEHLWPDAHTPRVLWHARLFPAFTNESNLAEILWLTKPSTLNRRGRNAWKRARRFSLADILELADPAQMAHHRDTLSGMLQATQWVTAIEKQTAVSVQNSINHFGPGGYQQLVSYIHAAATNEKSAFLKRARLYWSLAEIMDRPTFPKTLVKVPTSVVRLRQEAFNGIRDALGQAAALLNDESGRGPPQEPRMKCLGSLVASAPVRLDLAGGWTDTPPYCLDNGGVVVNVAVNLNGVEPIQSTFKPLPEPLVRLVARDLGKTLDITDPELFHRPLVPGDPFALQMAALRVTGLAPRSGEKSLKRWLERIGCRGNGFELTTASNLPKGSGMGTSSILGATTLAVLRAAQGLGLEAPILCDQTLLLEQLLGTGGGWQDQVGGIVGGVKISSTKPGLRQLLRVQKISLPSRQLAALQQQLVVYFTGQQRLARNILREVMGRYLSREPGTLVLFRELTQCAKACAAALRQGDTLACAAEINRYWRIKKDLFAGSTTPAVDELFLEMRPYYLAGCLSGAGGGGFAYFLCADGDQAHRLRTELARVAARPGSMGLTFAANINTRGLRLQRLDTVGRMVKNFPL